MDEAERKMMASALLGHSAPKPPNTELALLELAKAVIRLEEAVEKMAADLYPESRIMGAEPHKVAAVLGEAKADILRALIAITGKPHSQ